MEWWREFFCSGEYTLLDELPEEHTRKQVEFLVRALDLRTGMRVCDVACGIGRHALPLLERGVEVVGLDFTPDFVRRAADGRPGRFVRGDMRALPFEDASLDAAYNVFTSFGYFETDEEDAGVLAEIGRVLKPGGMFLLDTIHRDAIAHQFRDQGWTPFAGGYVLEERSWDPRRGPISTWIFVRDGSQRTFTVSVRAYTLPEVERMLAAGGLETEATWGDWDGGPLSLDGRRLIVKARKG